MLAVRTTLLTHLRRWAESRLRPFGCAISSSRQSQSARLLRLHKASFQVVSLRRREFITLIGGAAAMWPLAADGQKAERMRRIGVLMSASEDDPLMQARVTAFRQALAERGWTEGQTLKIEGRWTGGDITRVREYASELVRLAPDVLVANGTPNVAALKQATNS